ncbi:hypothetical protein Dimus_026625, partial [Dionaea muscipula]
LSSFCIFFSSSHCSCHPHRSPTSLSAGHHFPRRTPRRSRRAASRSRRHSLSTITDLLPPSHLHSSTSSLSSTSNCFICFKTFLFISSTLAHSESQPEHGEYLIETQPERGTRG